MAPETDASSSEPGHGHSPSKLSSTIEQHSSEIPGISPSHRLEDSKSVVECELIKAPFFVCFPTEICTPVSAPTTFGDSLETWVGGCELTVGSSDIAHAWVEKNYDEGLLVLIRERQIGGPIPSMLSVDSPALSIFGKMSASLIRVADELAKFSGFPVIVRPLEEDPSRFRNHECGPAGNTVADSAGGNSKQGDTSRASGSAHNVSQGGKANDRTDKSNKKGKERQKERDSDDEGEGKPGAPTSKSLPPIEKATSNEIVHVTDVTLKLSKDPTKIEKHFITVYTMVKLYPPNTNNPQPMKGTVSDSSIAGHIDLRIRSGPPVHIDNALGSVGFLAQSLDYLRSENFVPLGNSEPQKILKHITGKQRSKIFGGILGLAGGKPTASFSATSGKATSSTTEVADNEVAELWLASRQKLFCNWQTASSTYRGFHTQIQRHLPISTDFPDIRVKYGIASDVPKNIKAAPTTSLIYRHQVHCWVEDESKSGYRGIIVLAAHFIPNINTEENLWIQRTSTLDFPNMAVEERTNGSPNSNRDTAAQLPFGVEPTDHVSQETSEDRYAFAAAAAPQATKSTWARRSVQRLFKGRRDSEQETILPVSPLVSQGLEDMPCGWNHTEKKWYYPIWPDMNPTLSNSLDQSSTTWRLDWGGTDGS